MKSEQIKEIAIARGIKAGKMKKGELIRAIQSEEGNVPCFGTGKSNECEQTTCLWREDCE